MTLRTGSIIRQWHLVCALVVVALLGIAPRASAQTLTNTDVVKMVQAKLGDALIISEIKHSTCNFDTSPTALIKLKQAGVSDAVLQAMTEAGHAASSPAGGATNPTSTANIPIPENYGIYAVVDGQLVKLDSSPVRAKKTVDVRLGHRNGVGNILQGQAVAGSNVALVPEFEPDLKVLVYSEPSGPGSPLAIAQSLNLEPLVFIRNVAVDTGFPSHVRRAGLENGWDSGQAPELLGMATGGTPKALEFLFKPMPGHSDMVIATPSQALKPGIYKLREGEADPFSGGGGGLLFAVPPLNTAEANKCVDAMVTYAMAMSNIKYRPCGSPAPGAGSAAASGPGTGKSSAPAPPVVAACSSYSDCLSKGNAALKNKNWTLALADFKRGSTIDASKPGAWAGQGMADLPLGQGAAVPSAWDKALERTGTLILPVWHYAGFHIPRGVFWLNVKAVTFADSKGKTLFSVPPSQVSALQSHHPPLGGQAWSFGMKVNGHRYWFSFVPLGVKCSTAIRCSSPDGYAQEGVVSNYVVQAIPKLASGALVAAAPAPAPTPSGAAGTSANASNCSQAASAGYSIEAGGHTYKVEAFGPPGPNRVHVFLNESGAVVRESNLLQQLALGAWSKEMVIDRYTPASGSEQVKGLLNNYSNLQGWENATDILARATVESIKAVVTVGSSLDTAPQSLTLGIVKRQLTDPKVALAHWAHFGLMQSLADYQQMERLLPPAGTTVLKLTDLQQIESLYIQASTLASVNAALASAIAPTSWQDEFANYVSSALSELESSLPESTTFLTLNNVLKLEELVAAGGQSFSGYKHSLDQAGMIAKSTQGKISAWATQAATACASKTAAGAAPASTAAGNALAMLPSSSPMEAKSRSYSSASNK